MPFADIYSRYYNLLYKDKDYPTEFRYLDAIISLPTASAKSILDLGCGTGKHLRCFKESGYSVAGVDVSAAMLAAAKEQLGEDVDLINAKISEFYTDKKFNVITSLFHVMSYQTDTNELEKVFANAANHLVSGGLFIFDFWYGPAVLTDLPAVRIKRLADEEIKITRITEPVMRYNENIVEVNFELLIEPKTGGGAVKEQHVMRYFFLPEIKYLAEKAGLTVVASYKWLTQEPLSNNSWYGLVVLRKK